MRLLINKRFPARITRTSYALVSVVDPQGRPKILTVKPGNEKGNWLRSEWGHDGAGRKVKLVSVDLTTEREQAGALFLEQAYDEEHWPEGKAQWSSYVKAQYTHTVQTESGPVELWRERCAFKGHFPPHLLPKRVQIMQANAKVTKKGPMWEADETVRHPDDAENEEHRKNVDAEKAPVKSELAKASG